MQKHVLPEVEKYMKQSKKRRTWTKIVSVLACVVVFCTTYALILPAITQENKVTCTLAEHKHDENCYKTIVTEKLICTKPEIVYHEHTDECYEIVETAAQAGTSEANGSDEAAASQEETSHATEGGTAGQSSEENSSEISKENSKEDSEESAAESAIGTGTASGSDEETYQVQSGKESSTAEVVYEKVLVCTKPEKAVHEHTETCYEKIESEPTLSCELQEHVHGLACYADLTADVENSAVWEQTFADVELKGVWAEDVIAIAKTQLGYVESSKNYIVESKEEDGTIKETAKGYTRYGAWYGDAYGDWCAMFVSFCLDYAGVEGMPLEAYCPTWIEKLSAEDVNLYHTTGSYIPETGNLVFFDWDADGESDHVGIVTAVNSNTEDGVMEIETIEGNSNNRVAAQTYPMTDETIMGFAALPYQLSEEEQAEVDRVIAMIDAMPSAGEIDAKVEEFYEAEDEDGEIAYLEVTYQQVAEVYHYYDMLSEEQKAAVTNADKLLELEYIWSVTEYITGVSGITSAAPTPTWYTSTKDFIELNLYDYDDNINANWESNKKYPGFQWNGGAYSKYKTNNTSADLGIPNCTTNRHYVDSIDFGNSIISDFDYSTPTSGAYGKSASSISVGKLYNNSGASSVGKINWLWYDGSDYASTTNRPVGISTGYRSIAYTLGQDGYPALSDGTSLKYLFINEGPVTKKNTSSVDGLFQKDSITGEYSYNSRTNHAQYSNNFFTLYDDIITPNFIVYPFGNFLPFNTISDLSKATQVGAINYSGGMNTYVNGIIAKLDRGLVNSNDYQYAAKSQLKTMLLEYQENWELAATLGTSWDALSADNAIKDYFLGDSSGNGDTPSSDTAFIKQEHLDRMYNIDWDVATDFFFGMEMKMEFMQPKSGMTGNDTNGDGQSDYPMIFEFTGDDDVWVYIDGALFLDLTGIHRHVGGTIDFVNGKVHYYELDPEHGGDISGSPYKTFSFAELLEAAGKSTDVLNDNGTFKDYSTHSFNFYYMERGSGSSVCRMNFNFPLLKKNAISVTKENITVDSNNNNLDTEVLGNPDYYFNIMGYDGNNSSYLFIGPGYDYKVKDIDGKIIKNEDGTDRIYKTNQWGIFTLKAGQTAIFEGISEDAGQFYVQELIKEEDNDQYPNVYVNGQEVQFKGMIDWSARKDYFTDHDASDSSIGPDGYRWYGKSGQFSDSSSNTSFYFEQQNHLNVDSLGSLAITKEVEGEKTDKVFEMEVLLDGVKLPVGTKYKIGDTEYAVETEGIIQVQASQTAILSNIISGTQFTIREVNGGDYTVTYSSDSEEITDNNGSSISGVVRVNTQVAITVTNTEQGASVTIPVTKSFKVNGENNMPHQYTFKLEQVTDQTGTTLVPKGTTLTQDVDFEGNTHSFEFQLAYLKHNVTGTSQKFYYRITEEQVDATSQGDATSLPNSQKYVVEVTVTKTDNGLNAEVTNIWSGDGEKNANEIAFVNTLTGSLKLEKIVAGLAGTDRDAAEFRFKIYLEKGKSGLEELPTSYEALLTQANGDSSKVKLTLDSGVISLIQVHHGETACISGIPIGTTWKIVEEDYEGYNVTSQVIANGTIQLNGGIESSGSIIVGETKVTYTNTAGYELPESGGAGTTLYTMAGLMLVLCSAAFLLCRYQKRRKEAK